MRMVSAVVRTPGAGTAPVRWPQRLGSSASDAAASAHAPAAAAASPAVSGDGMVTSSGKANGPQATSLSSAVRYSVVGIHG